MGGPNREQSLIAYRHTLGHLNRRARSGQRLGASGISGRALRGRRGSEVSAVRGRCCPRTTWWSNLSLEHFGLEGPGKEKALHFVDVFVPEMVHLAGRFHALGERLEAEVPAELDECPDERFGLRRGCDRAGEASIDLEAVHRELLKVGKRRVAGAEVVHRDPTPRSLMAWSRRAVASAWRIRAVSGISIINEPASRPLALRASEMYPMMASSSS